MRLHENLTLFRQSIEFASQQLKYMLRQLVKTSFENKIPSANQI